MSRNQFEAGKYIKLYCSRCKLDLGHTVLAVMNGTPVRVRCDTCKSERNYKAPKPTIVREIRPRTTRTVSPASYEKKIQESLMKTPRPYNAAESFEVGDVIDHKKFGRGVVTKMVFPDRMDVLFEDEARTLLRKVT